MTNLQIAFRILGGYTYALYVARASAKREPQNEILTQNIIITRFKH